VCGEDHAGAHCADCKHPLLLSSDSHAAAVRNADAQAGWWFVVTNQIGLSLFVRYHHPSCCRLNGRMLLTIKRSNPLLKG
jgi:hypothetical protein